MRLAPIFALAAVAAFGAPKEKIWTNATVLEWKGYTPVSGANPSQVGRSDNGSTLHVNSVNSSSGIMIEDFYVLETQDAVYVLGRTRMKMGAQLVLPPRTVVPLAVEKSKAWIMDHQGTKYEMRVIDLNERAVLSQAP